jgi:hypothetical protein
MTNLLQSMFHATTSIRKTGCLRPHHVSAASKDELNVINIYLINSLPPQHLV